MEIFFWATCSAIKTLRIELIRNDSWFGSKCPDPYIKSELFKTVKINLKIDLREPGFKRLIYTSLQNGENRAKTLP